MSESIESSLEYLQNNLLEKLLRTNSHGLAVTDFDSIPRHAACFLQLGGFHIFGVATQAACVNLPVDGEETEDAAYDFARGEQRVAKPDNRSADRWT